MALITWQEFSRRPEIKSLPLHEQKKQFLWENQRRTEENWFLEARLMNGGGGGGGFAGNASDGPIAGATVTSNVGTTTTDALGNFTFPQTPTSEITVTGGTDSITGVAFTGELKGFPEYKTVSPLTTLAYHLKEETKGTRDELTADGAIDLLFASSSTLFGVELDVADKDIMLNKDYVAESVLGNNQKAIAAQSIATYLESVTETVGSAIKNADDSRGTPWTDNNAKIQGYKSIARQIRDTAGAKTEIDPETLFDKVKLPDGGNWTVTGSLDTSARRTLKSSLDIVRRQLGELSRSELYNANYLTTQIQAVNRGVKEDYKVQARRLAKGETANFRTVNVLITESTGSLAQIEEGKANETDANTSKKPSREFFQLGAMTYTMQEKGQDAVTLSFKRDPGQMFVVGTEIRRGQFLNNDSGPFRPTEAENFAKSAPTIIATQVTASNGKVYEITLANPGFQVLSSQLKDATKYLPVAAGGYTLQESMDGIKWQTSPLQPFTASIAANQTSTSGTVTSKFQTTLGELEYNSRTSRYEYSTTSNPPKGTKTLQAHIADFTNEATWTRLNAKDAYRRFQINNVDTHHIAGTGTYTLSKERFIHQETLSIRPPQSIGGTNSLRAGEISQFEISSEGIQVTHELGSTTKFRVVVDGVTVTPPGGSSFSNNTMQFTISGKGDIVGTYTITYTT